MARVYISDIIEAPVERVWSFSRDFNGHGDWHPRIAQSRIEEDRPADQVGSVRNFDLEGGGNLREQLLAFSDAERSFSYCILVSPMPVENYVATYRCTPVTERQATFVEWWADFEVSPEEEPAIRRQVGQDTFAAGIRAIAERVGSGDR